MNFCIVSMRAHDIALLPEHRGAGIGGRLLQDLLTEAAASGKRVSIHVERFNPAMRLYERLGFTKQEEVGVYFRMEWSAGQKNAASTEHGVSP